MYLIRHYISIGERYCLRSSPSYSADQTQLESDAEDVGAERLAGTGARGFHSSSSFPRGNRAGVEVSGIDVMKRHNWTMHLLSSVPNSTSATTFGRSVHGGGVLMTVFNAFLKPFGQTKLPN